MKNLLNNNEICKSLSVVKSKARRKKSKQNAKKHIQLEVTNSRIDNSRDVLSNLRSRRVKENPIYSYSSALELKKVRYVKIQQKTSRAQRMLSNIPSNKELISTGRLSGCGRRINSIKYQNQACTLRYKSRRLTSPGRLNPSCLMQSTEASCLQSQICQSNETLKVQRKLTTRCERQ